MENQILYEKTAKGVLQAGGRSRALPEDLQQLLLAVDGATPAGLLADTHGAGVPRVVLLGLRRLADMGFIRVMALPQGSGACSGAGGAVTSDLDFTTLAE
jgi:hypothetical protein